MSEIPPPPPPVVPAMPPSAGSAYTKNWMGITALILAIVGLLLACCWGAGFLFAAGGLVLGLLGKKAADAGEANNRGMSQAGFIMGIIGLVLSIVGFIAIVAFSFAPTDWSTY